MRRTAPALAVLFALACEKPAIDENFRPLGAGAGAPGPTGGLPTAGSGSVSAGASGSGAGGSPSIAGSGGGGNAGGSSGSASTNGGETPPFTKSGLRRALADCAMAQYADFAEHAQALRAAVEALDAAANLDAARQAWREAMASWQRAELLRFGPAAASSAPGGQDLRDHIYAFPLSNYCAVDQRIVDQSYEQADFGAIPSNARGLAAIEYLLFHQGPDNACSSALAINVNGTWAALGADELAERRLAYAARAARDVDERAQALVLAWSPNGGDFAAQFTDPGRGGSVYTSEQQAFNAVSDALLYIEKELKDYKLGWPLGLVPECLNAPAPCPNEVESRYAGVSADHIRQNLIGFSAVFEGCGAGPLSLGFDDWLEAVGAGDLADRMLAAAAGARASVESLDRSLGRALLEEPARVTALHAAVKGLTDLLKTEFITVLDFELPMALEGDND